MATTQVSPIGNPHNFIRGTMTAQNDTLTLAGALTQGAVCVQLAGTWTGTITFQATVDGTNYFTVGLFPAATPNASVATAPTAVGAWADLMKFRAYRLNCTAAITGTVEAAISFLQGQF